MDWKVRVKAGYSGNGNSFGLMELKKKLMKSFDGKGDSNLCEYTAASLYDALYGISPNPTYFEVCGEDGFYARIPWRMADRSFFCFPNIHSNDVNSELRLFIQENTNACLNVKSITEIQFEYDNELEQPIYGNK